MGDIQFNNRNKREQFNSGSFLIPNFDRQYIIDSIKRALAMAETKLAAILLNLIGIPLCFVTLLNKVENWKDVVGALVAFTFIVIRIYYFVVWANQKTRKNELELRKLEKELGL